MDEKRKFVPDSKLKLMEQVRETLRYHHYAYRTEQTYCEWIKRFLRHYGFERHPRDMGADEVERFLSHLATKERVAEATQRQALNSIVFLYRHVLDVELGEMAPVRGRKGRRPPTVLTKEEVGRVLGVMQGTHGLMARLTYGCGLRLMECVRLRVQDVDFGQGRLFVREGKGGKDRSVILPVRLFPDLEAHIEKVRQLHDADVRRGFGEVYLPDALLRKYSGAAREFGWQYVFPSKNLSEDPRSGKTMRHHVLESGFQKAVKTAVQRAAVYKRATVHTLRHSYATHLLENGVNIRQVQELMGHKDVKTTEIYTHVMNKDIGGVKSPLDLL